MAADGSLSFDTKIDESGLESGVSKAESSLKAILGELKKISAAISNIPTLKVSADTSEVTAAKEAIDDIPKETEVEIDVDTNTEPIDNTKNAIDNVGKGAKNTSEEVSQAFKKASKNANTAVGSSCDDILKTMSSMLGKVKGLVAAAGISFGIKQIIEFGKEATESAAEINAATSQLNQTFGALQNNAEEAIKRVAKQSGILETRLNSTATGIYAFAKTSGMDSTTALGMMEEALQVAADSAAYYDRSLEETSETLKSFLKGNYANDAALGLSATETTRNAAANRLYGKSFQELSEAQKQLTLLQMVKDANQLSGAMGQAARESDGWENVLGNLKEAWKQLLAVIGQPILYVATAAVKQITVALEYLTARAREAVSALSELFGVEFGNTAAVADNISAAVQEQEALTEAVEDTEKAQKGSLAAFDQLNTIAPDKEESSGTSAASTALQTVSPQVETKEAENKITKFVDKLKNTLGGFITWLKSNFGDKFTEIWNKLKDRVATLKETFAGVFEDIKSLAEPFLAWFNDYFTPFLQSAFSLIGDILDVLLGAFNRVFSTIWNSVVFPFLQTYLETGLPMLTEFATEAVDTLDTLLLAAEEVFNTIWDECVEPVLTWIMDKWKDVVESFKKFWDKWGAPIFEKLREAINNAKDTFLKAWDTVIKPVIDKLMVKADEIWDKHLKPLMENVLDLVGTFIDAALDIYNEFISPIVQWMVEKFGPPLVKVIDTIIGAVSAMLGNIMDATSGIIDYLKGVINFVTGVFTGDWDRAWEGIKQSFEGIWGAFVDIVKVPLNAIIGFLNSFLNDMEIIMQSIGDALGVMDFDIPDWVPGIGGKSFHLDLGTIDLPRIPYLAQGTVIPANYGNFLAMLGDNKREAEVVSPISTMKQAMLEALAEAGGNGPKEITLYTYLYPNSAAYHREVINIVNEDARNRGV